MPNVTVETSRLREACEQDHDLGYELMKRMTQVVIQRLQATRKQLLASRASAVDCCSAMNVF